MFILWVIIPITVSRRTSRAGSKTSIAYIQFMQEHICCWGLRYSQDVGNHSDAPGRRQKRETGQLFNISNILNTMKIIDVFYSRRSLNTAVMKLCVCLLTTCLPPGPEVHSWRLLELPGNRRLLPFRSARRRYFFSRLIILCFHLAGPSEFAELYWSALSLSARFAHLFVPAEVWFSKPLCFLWRLLKLWFLSFSLHLSVNVWIIKDKSINSFLIMLKQNIINLKNQQDDVIVFPATPFKGQSNSSRL